MACLIYTVNQWWYGIVLRPFVLRVVLIASPVTMHTEMGLISRMIGFGGAV